MIGCDILLTINIVVFFVLSWFEFCRKCVYAFSCNAIETIIIYTQAIEKGDWWSNTSHNVDRANLHWFLFPIDTNEFNGELTINADSLWLWCLLCINSTRLLHHLLGSHVLSIEFCRYGLGHMHSKSFASWLLLMRCRKQKWSDLIWFKCAHTLHVEKRQKILWMWAQQKDMWMWRNLRSIRDGTCSWCTRL